MSCGSESALISGLATSRTGRMWPRWWSPLALGVGNEAGERAAKGNASDGGLEGGLFSGASDHSSIVCGLGRYGSGTPGRAIAMHPSESKNVAKVSPSLSLWIEKRCPLPSFLWKSISLVIAFAYELVSSFIAAVFFA